VVNAVWLILIPLFTAVLQLFALRRVPVQRSLGLCGALVQVIAAWQLFANTTLQERIEVVHLGNWEAPVGIVFVADGLSTIMVLIAAVVGLCGLIFALRDASTREELTGFHPLYQILIAGICGAFLTGDLFNLYVFFEIVLMASFVLLAMGGRVAQLEGALKYVVLNIIASFVFLIGLGILYGKTGTLNMADLAARVADPSDPTLPMTAVVLLVLAFAIKAGVFPLFFWLPPAYPAPGFTVSAVFAGLLTKVGIYALLRVFVLIFQGGQPWLQDLLLVAGVLTMIAGIIGAVSQMDIRRILSFHSISQIGYIIIGIAIMTPAALAAALFFICHHSLVKANLYFVGGIIARKQGTENLTKLGGLYRNHTGLALLFLIPALSLAGIPPLSGFFAKWLLIRSAIEAQAYFATFACLAVGLFTLFSMCKIWAATFWQDPPEAANITEEEQPMTTDHDHRSLAPLYLPVIALVILTVLVGLFPETLFRLSAFAAEQLLNPQAYIEAVLGKAS
jgi:multicomponent Na+:H+ antiporter subunit D